MDETPFSWNCNSILNIFSVYNELAVLAVDKKKNQGSREWHEKKTSSVFILEYTGHYLHPASVHLSLSTQQIYSRSKLLLI